MALPFRSLNPPEIVDVCGFQIPKKGCLTVAEEEALRNYQLALEKEMEGLSEPQKDLKLKRQLVTMLFQSRLDPAWTLEKTCAPEWEVETEGGTMMIAPDMAMLDGLFEFFMDEQKRWGNLKPSEGGTKKKEPTGSEPGSDSATSSPPSKNSKKADLVTAP